MRQRCVPSPRASCRAARLGRSLACSAGARCRRAIDGGMKEGDTKTMPRQSARLQPVSCWSWRTACRPIVTSSSREIARASMPVWWANLRGIESPNQAFSSSQEGWCNAMAAMPRGVSWRASMRARVGSGDRRRCRRRGGRQGAGLWRSAAAGASEKSAAKTACRAEMRCGISRVRKPVRHQEKKDMLPC